MGCNCNCLQKNPEYNNEMVEGVIPGLGIKSSKRDNFDEIKIINTENDDEIYKNDKEKNENNNSLLIKKDLEKEENEEDLENLKLANIQTGLSPNTLNRVISQDSSILSKMQELSETIFDYLNEIRTSPDDYEKNAEEHKVSDILQKVINDSISHNNLIANTYNNLILSECINNNMVDGENNEQLMEILEKQEKIKNYDKKLFVIDGDVDEPNEVVWKLIEDNKNIAYETFFSNSIENLTISCQKINNKKFKCYFLFLSKK